MTVTLWPWRPGFCGSRWRQTDLYLEYEVQPFVSWMRKALIKIVAHFSELVDQWNSNMKKEISPFHFQPSWGDDTFTVPMSEFYDVIDTERLLPDDLTAQILYWRTPPNEWICSDFDDGPDQPRLLRHSHLKKYNCQSYLLYGRKNVSAGPILLSKSAKEVIKSEPHAQSTQLPKVSLDNAKKSWCRSCSKSDRCADQRLPSPYGAINNAINTGDKPSSFIMWDVDGLDWKTHSRRPFSMKWKRSQTGFDYPHAWYP